MPSVSPLLLVGEPAPGVVLDANILANEQYLFIGEHWSSYDANFKMLATDKEKALVLSAGLPLQEYDAMTFMPLLYIFTYEKPAVSSPDGYAFLYGRLIPFSDLKEYQVYGDEKYICYEVSSMVYSDLKEYTQSFVKQSPNIRYDDQAWARVENIYQYYKENLEGLFYYK